MADRNSVGYLNNIFIKPLSVDTLGNVLFTSDGVTKIKPNQLQCEAYGYKYEKATGTCRAYNFKPNYETQVNNIGNTITGIDSDIRRGTQHSKIIGDFNTNLGTSTNTIILGDKNTINEYVDNSIAIGVSAESTSCNSTVLGGNNPTDILGARQLTNILYGSNTTDDVSTNSYLNNTASKYWRITKNTAVYFHCDIVALRVGGTSRTGNISDTCSYTLRGVLTRGETGASIISSKSDTISSIGLGTSSWQVLGMVNVEHDLLIMVKGDRDMIIDWSISVSITQMKTNILLPQPIIKIIK